MYSISIDYSHISTYDALWAWRGEGTLLTGAIRGYVDTSTHTHTPKVKHPLQLSEVDPWMMKKKTPPERPSGYP